MARLARVVDPGLPHHITEGETADNRISSASRITPARIDWKSDAPSLKVPVHFTSLSRLGRVPSVSWDDIVQETAAIFDGGPQNARRKTRRTV